MQQQIVIIVNVFRRSQFCESETMRWWLRTIKREFRPVINVAWEHEYLFAFDLIKIRKQPLNRVINQQIRGDGKSKEWVAVKSGCLWATHHKYPYYRSKTRTQSDKARAKLAATKRIHKSFSYAISSLPRLSLIPPRFRSCLRVLLYIQNVHFDSLNRIKAGKN